MVFKPKYSVVGWIGMIFTPSLFFLLVKTFPLPKEGQISPPAYIVLILLILIFLFSIFFLLIYPTIRYEMKEDALYLKCGPFRYKILYSTISKIFSANLEMGFYHGFGWKLPGFALGPVYYIDRGTVNMCATRMTKDILLIQTKEGKL
jgi:uncharacterized membrane protein YdbT with pleckstrin-like domain